MLMGIHCHKLNHPDAHDYPVAQPQGIHLKRKPESLEHDFSFKKTSNFRVSFLEGVGFGMFHPLFF